MDTDLCDSANVIEKLNIEFDNLQSENELLKSKLKEYDQVQEAIKMLEEMINSSYGGYDNDRSSRVYGQEEIRDLRWSMELSDSTPCRLLHDGINASTEHGKRLQSLAIHQRRHDQSSHVRYCWSNYLVAEKEFTNNNRINRACGCEDLNYEEGLTSVNSLGFLWNESWCGVSVEMIKSIKESNPNVGQDEEGWGCEIGYPYTENGSPPLKSLEKEDWKYVDTLDIAYPSLRIFECFDDIPDSAAQGGWACDFDGYGIDAGALVVPDNLSTCQERINRIKEVKNIRLYEFKSTDIIKYYNKEIKDLPFKILNK